MIFNWQYQGDSKQSVRKFLQQKGMSRTLLKKIKFYGGQLQVAKMPVTVKTMLQPGQTLTVKLPPEPAQAPLTPSDTPLQILWEDAHFLIIDKPAQVASLPAHAHPLDSMAQRVLGYYQRQGYTNQVIHLVTRLDRGTSGVMLFAKHAFAHTLLAQQLQTGRLKKNYLAIVRGHLASQHNRLTWPIKRAPHSFIKRTTAVGGRTALTEYWQVSQLPTATLVRIHLHTGRTHQIRVHFATIGHPLLGDQLYAGPKVGGLSRPALHCAQLKFYHPFLKRTLTINSPLPTDLQQLLRFETK